MLLTSLAQIGTYVATFGLPAAVLAAAASNNAPLRQIVSVAGAAAIFAGVVLTAAGIPLLHAVGAALPPLPLLLLGNVSVAWLILIGWFYYGTQRFLRGGMVRTVPIVVAAGGVGIARLLGDSRITALFAAWVIPSVVVGAVVAVGIARETGFGRVPFPLLRTLCAYGVRFSGSQIAQLGALRLDQWLVALMGSTGAVGIYSIAASSSESVLVAATAIGIVVFSDAASGSTSKVFRRQMRFALIAVFAAAVVLAVTARHLVPLVFGSRYAGATTPLMILLVGCPGLVILRLVTNRLAGLGAPGAASICSLAALLATTALDIALIPPLGIDGAALASAIGYSVGGAAALVALRRATSRALLPALVHA